MKTDNQIAPHIRKTIEEIDGDIAALNQDIADLSLSRATLVKLYGGETEIPAPDVVKAKPAKPAKAVKPAKTKAPVAAINHGDWTPKTGSITHNVLVAVAKAPEPFSVNSLLVMLPGMDKAALGTELWKLGRAGYVAEAGKEGNMKLYKRGTRSIVAA